MECRILSAIGGIAFSMPEYTSRKSLAASIRFYFPGLETVHELKVDVGWICFSR
jgi:hypothetical protein